MQTKWIALVLAGAILFTVMGCGPSKAPTAVATRPSPTSGTSGTRPGPTATRAQQAEEICAPGNAPSYLTDLVTARTVQGVELDASGITDVFSPDQATLHAVASVDNGPPNLKLRAIWYLVEAVGFQPNSRIDESESAIDPDGSGNVDFTLKPASGVWPPGEYCVEIYAEGNLAASKTFRVEAAGETPEAGLNPIVAIIMASDIKPETFEPVNPTDVFTSDARAIYASVQIKDSPPGTVYRARWYPPGMEPINTELIPGPSVWLDFHLFPVEGGFPRGDYKVEIYVNDQLTDSRNFKVE